MKKKLDLACRRFQEAVRRLSEGAQEPPRDIVRDGVIQRFEFTFELAWKTLKILLEEKGILSSSPRDALQNAFRQGWIEADQAYLSMLADRNRTTHLYDENQAAQIYEKVKQLYLPLLQQLAERLAREAQSF